MMIANKYKKMWALHCLSLLVEPSFIIMTVYAAPLYKEALKVLLTTDIYACVEKFKSQKS